MPAERSAGLTERERQVMALVAKGHTNKAIARETGMSPHTVAGHMQDILRKYNVPNRAAAVDEWRRRGNGA
jgi:DNA-binding CsgD family transcriptional regulator